MATEARDADDQAEKGGPSRRSIEPDRAGGDAHRTDDSATDSTDDRASRFGFRGRIGLGRDRRASLALSVQRDNRFTAVIRATCFWMAISLPFLYLPLLIAGVETRAEGLALLALLALNAFSLLVGHTHRSR